MADGPTLVFKIAVSPLTGNPLSVMPDAGIVSSVGEAVNRTFSWSGGTNPIQLHSADFSLFEGLVFSDGGVTGTPTGRGSEFLTFVASDSSVPQQMASNFYSIAIGDANGAAGFLPSVVPTVGSVGEPYSAKLGDTCTLASGSVIPSGLTVNACELSGLPDTPGTTQFNITADLEGSTARNAIVVRIGAASDLVIDTWWLAPVTTGAAYSGQIAASGGDGAYFFQVAAGSLPNGISMGTDGAFSGVPTVAGTFEFSVSVTDAQQVSAHALIIEVD